LVVAVVDYHLMRLLFLIHNMEIVVVLVVEVVAVLAHQ